MESSVEDGHLWNLAEDALDDFNAFQLGAVVKRSECFQARDDLFDVGSNSGGLDEFWPSVYDAMPNNIDFRRSIQNLRLACPECFQHALNGALAVTDIDRAINFDSA